MNFNSILRIMIAYQNSIIVICNLRTSIMTRASVFPFPTQSLDTGYILYFQHL